MQVYWMVKIVIKHFWKTRLNINVVEMIFNVLKSGRNISLMVIYYRNRLFGTEIPYIEIYWNKMCLLYQTIIN